MRSQLIKTLLLLTISISTTHLYPSNAQKIQQLEKQLKKIDEVQTSKYNEKQVVKDKVWELQKEFKELENEAFQKIKKHYKDNLNSDYFGRFYIGEIREKDNIDTIENKVKKGCSKESYPNNEVNKKKVERSIKLCEKALKFIEETKNEIAKRKNEIEEEVNKKNKRYNQLNKEFDNAGYLNQKTKIEEQISLLREDSSTTPTNQEKNKISKRKKNKRYNQLNKKLDNADYPSQQKRVEKKIEPLRKDSSTSPTNQEKNKEETKKKSIKEEENKKPPEKNTNYNKNQLNPTTLLLVGLAIISFVYLVYKLTKHKGQRKETSHQPI